MHKATLSVPGYWTGHSTNGKSEKTSEWPSKMCCLKMPLINTPDISILAICEICLTKKTESINLFTVIG
ncbi:MAG: hypothetical protein A4E65_02517 [Syntrophorhabdus sp. PtaU1.Bin153]|nr:MAG: hypothetical protein A4E65_02517 [Syntrophorhabdus sp. PtaU1.Bin153]